jgi:hypothetical protein
VKERHLKIGQRLTVPLCFVTFRKRRKIAKFRYVRAPFSPGKSRFVRVPDFLK